MEQHRFSRTELLIKDKGIEKLKNSKVCVLGVGGVGGAVVEALARVGIGTIVIVDDDVIDITNINRQLIATEKTIGKIKVEVAKERIKDINPECNVITYKTFIKKDNISIILTSDIDYVVDAIDTVTSKLDVIEYCKKNNIRIISSLGTGNKFDPTKFKIADISKTDICPLAKVMRRELKKRRISKVKVLYSEELVTKPSKEDIDRIRNNHISTGNGVRGVVKRQIPGSMSFIPPVAGFILGSEVVNTLLKEIDN